MKLSIVSTLYQSAPHIEEFYNRVIVVAKQLAGDDYEIVLVNDGSPDNSLDLAIRLAEQDSHVVVVDLSRNFGHHKAMIAGLDQAQGERIFLIDSDLEEEPEWLLDFDAAMASEEADVIYGVQLSRKGGWLEKLSGEIYFSTLKLLSKEDLPRNVVTARLMTREFLKAMLSFEEKDFVIGSLTSLTGFKQSKVKIKKLSHSPTTYNWRSKLSLFIDVLTSLSSRPLSLVFYFGFFSSLVAFFLVIFIVLRYVIYGSNIQGWNSLIAVSLLMGGLNIFVTGILGIYISKIFTEVKSRPRYIVKRKTS